MATMKQTKYFDVNRSHICKFCALGFSSEKTLSAHLCAKKRRFADKDTVISRLAFRIFQRFYQLAMKTTTPKTEMDFINSNTYVAFIKFARHLHSTKPFMYEQYIDHVMLNGVKMSDWALDKTYQTFICDYIAKESPMAALERSILTIDEWAATNNEDFMMFFKKVSPTDAAYMIRSGKISPWLLYLSSNADQLFIRLGDDQVELIANMISPKVWGEVFSRKVADVEYLKGIIAGANI